MSESIQVILLEDVDGLGHSGDIVSVSHSKATELFESGIGAKADAPAATSTKSDAGIDGIDLIVTSNNPETIAETISKQHKLNVKPEDVTVAEHEATLRLPDNSTATVTLILAEDDEEA